MIQCLLLQLFLIYEKGVYKINLKVSDGEYFDYDEIFIVVNETGNSLPSIKLDQPIDGSYYKGW